MSPGTGAASGSYERQGNALSESPRIDRGPANTLILA